VQVLLDHQSLFYVLYVPESIGMGYILRYFSDASRDYSHTGKKKYHTFLIGQFDKFEVSEIIWSFI
jgi:hypothetical protein